MSSADPLKIAKKAMATLRRDRDNRLLKIDDYERGIQDKPYEPDTADEEYKKLAQRSITNVMPFLISTPKQMMKGDSFRRGNTSVVKPTVTQPSLSEAAVTPSSASTDAVQPEWDHWQRSRMDGKQAAIYHGALKFGHSFVLTFEDPVKGILSKGLSALKTVALYVDPANDDDPYAALTITHWPVVKDGKVEDIGTASMWDDALEYDVLFESFEDLDSLVVGEGVPHGADVCPVTRFVAAMDLEGRTVGVVEPMFVLQDRINQTVFDLLIVQSFASFKVRTIAGMTPPIKMKAVDEEGNTLTDITGEDDPRIFEWRAIIGPDGNPVYDEINLNARRAFIAEDPETKFSTLDETPLDGFIKAIELAFRHMAALSQTPPHHILGDIANLSAEALEAAELSLSRKVEEFKTSFGESWERVFRVAAQIDQRDEGANDFSGELIWRDLSKGNLAQAADALGKIATQLGVPMRGLWSRIPNVTANELATWETLRKSEPNPALPATNAGTGAKPTFRRTVTANQPDTAGSSAA